MNCPHDDTKLEVTDSRMNKMGTRRRRMRCPKCNQRFTSYEMMFDETRGELICGDPFREGPLSDFLMKFARRHMEERVRKQILAELAGE